MIHDSLFISVSDFNIHDSFENPSSKENGFSFGFYNTKGEQPLDGCPMKCVLLYIWLCKTELSFRETGNIYYTDNQFTSQPPST